MHLHDLLADLAGFDGAGVLETRMGRDESAGSHAVAAVDVTSVVHDSREAGPGSLFCCIRGSVTDGHRYAAAAVASGAVALLVEMLADDRALRGGPARELVSALVRFGTAGICPAPAGALAVAEGEVAARVTRLLQPSRPLPAVAVMAVCLAAALLVAAPVTLLIV